VADSDTCERSVVRAVADRCFPLPYVANATPTTTDADYWTVSQLNCYSGHRFFISFLTTQCRLGFSRTSVPITSRYDRTPICDRQTQTQTDRQTDTRPQLVRSATGCTASLLTCYSGHRFFVGGLEFDWMVMACQSNGWWSPILTSCERTSTLDRPHCHNYLRIVSNRLSR